MICQFCEQPMQESEMLEGPRCVGLVFDCVNPICPFLTQEGTAYQEEKTHADFAQEYVDEAAEDAYDHMRDAA